MERLYLCLSEKHKVLRPEGGFAVRPDNARDVKLELEIFADLLRSWKHETENHVRRSRRKMPGDLDLLFTAAEEGFLDHMPDLLLIEQCDQIGVAYSDDDRFAEILFEKQLVLAVAG